MAVVLLISGPPAGSIAAYESSDQPSGGVTGLLRIQVALKRAQMSHPDPTRLRQMEALGLRTDDLSRQLVFVHFGRRPDGRQARDMESMGIALYQDTWIPPVGDHTDGLMTARVPVDRVYDLARKPYVTLLNTAEEAYQPMNDRAVSSVRADDLWALGHDGSGVRVAVLDSGLDITHDDIPTPTVGLDYSDYSDTDPDTDTTIANQVTDHGTHVTGSVLGRGAYTTTYRGSAPGADLIFLKIGDDTDASASTGAIVAAIKAAADTYDADIITMSYGGWSTYMDGTSETAQAVDYAFSQGAAVFMAAGNEASADRHYSGTAFGNTSTADITVDVGSGQTALAFRLIWWDGPASNDLDLEIYDSGHNPIAADTTEEGESPRGTESDLIYVNTADAGTYYLKVVNHSAATQDFHVYSYQGDVTFASADPAYTVTSPATADGAVAVGAYVTRESWRDWEGNGPWSYGQTLGTMATFSSQGPRVDGWKKPDIAAPASAIISALDSDVPTDDMYVISDTGINDGKQPHHYRVMQGTSMASPLAAGAAALLLDKYPDLKGQPHLIHDRMQRTASNNGMQTNTDGYGYLDIFSAAKLIETPSSTSPADAGAYDSPSRILVKILKPAVDLSGGHFGVKIGDKSADVIAVDEGETEYTLEVMPPPQSTTGSYDLEVTVIGVSEIQANAIRYSAICVYLPLALRAYPTWTSSGLAGRTVYALSYDPTDCTTRYAGTGDGVYKSTDTGSSWSAAGLDGLRVTSVAVDPSAPQTVYAATWGEGVYVSPDGGGAWTEVNEGLDETSSVFPVVVTPNGEALYAGTDDGGVFKSAGDDVFWWPANTGLTNLHIRSVTLDPSVSSVLYAGTTDGVYKTTDGATSWSAASSGLYGRTVASLAVHPTDSATIFAGTDAGVYRSTNGGGSWTQVGCDGISILGLAIDALDPKRIYAGTDGSGVYRSLDSGDTWVAVNAGLGNLTVEALAFDDGPCHTLQAASHDGVWTYLE